MQNLKVYPGVVRGSCLIPPSKSETQRALLLAAFAKGASEIHNPLLSPDTKRFLIMLQEMGVKIEIQGQTVGILGIGDTAFSLPKIIDCGNSGILLRFLTGICASFSQPVTFTGDFSLQQLRSSSSLLDALKMLGVKVTYHRKEGFAPYTIEGPFRTEEVVVEGSDSQPVSALLLASAISGRPLTIEIKNPGEWPWVEMTLSWLSYLKVPVKQEGNTKIAVAPQKRFCGFSYSVPADLSTAAFPAAAALISGGSVVLEGVDLTTRQGDKKLFSFFGQMGAKVETIKRGVFVEAIEPLEGIEIDGNECIDAIAALSAVATVAKTPTTIRNVEAARRKECDRLSSIAKEWGKLGIKVDQTQDSLTIFPKKPLGGVVNSCCDHRIAMSLAVLGLAACREVIIEDTSCIEKTFADFSHVLNKLGARCAVC